MSTTSNGVWLRAKTRAVRLRDGLGPDDPMYTLTPGDKPVFFTKRCREQHAHDRDVEVVSKKAPSESEVKEQIAEAEAEKEARLAAKAERADRRIETALERAQREATEEPDAEDAAADNPQGELLKVD